MIPRDYVTEWRSHAPWVRDSQVEQDLILSRALVELFQNPRISAALAFRGGTALYKLHSTPPARYSEDLDFVQIASEPIGATLDALREVLDPWLGNPRRRVGPGTATLTYRFESEESPPVPLRLKLEINSRERASVFGLLHQPFRVDTRWFRGAAKITSYELDELLGTKLRALFQRKKGRDLFDLATALDHLDVDPDRIVVSFLSYLEAQGLRITRAQFEQNLLQKEHDAQFRADIRPLLAPGQTWDFERGLGLVRRELLPRLPGSPPRRRRGPASG